MLQSYRIEWLICEICDAQHPAKENMSPGVPRETRCQRCLIAEISHLRRLLRKEQYVLKCVTLFNGV